MDSTASFLNLSGVDALPGVDALVAASVGPTGELANWLSAEFGTEYTHAVPDSIRSGRDAALPGALSFCRMVVVMPKYVVRYGIMRSLGVLAPRGRDKAYHRGDRVVARTKRGLESGEVLCEATAEATAHLEDAEKGEILRRMSTNDVNELAHIQSHEGDEFLKCQQYVEKLGLEMDLVDLEHVFGGERIVVYYLAEKRVDFRELVRQLAREFQTRIEMRQIGVRDEAKLLADYGDCGKPVCCNTHLTAMPPVSMKMAKLQKATLDPTKISGRCGRLKCCLRFEYDTYEEMRKELPPIGSEIVTNLGKAEVLGHEILASQLLVRNEEGRRILIDANTVLSITKRGTGSHRRKDRQKGTDSKAAGSTRDTKTKASGSAVEAIEPNTNVAARPGISASGDASDSGDAGAGNPGNPTETTDAPTDRPKKDTTDDQGK